MSKVLESNPSSFYETAAIQALDPMLLDAFGFLRRTPDHIAAAMIDQGRCPIRTKSRLTSDPCGSRERRRHFQSDFNAPEIGEILKSCFGTPEVEPVDRARLLKLVWDVTSTEFGSRHAHYEQFYQGAPHVYLWQLAEQSRLDELGRIATNALSKD